MPEPSAHHSPSSRRPRAASTGALLSWAFYDFANSSFPTVILTFVFSAYFVRSVAGDATAGHAQWGTAVGIAGLVVALGGPVLGAIADRVGRRKPWIIAFSLACVTASALLWFVEPGASHVVLALTLVAIGIVATEFAGVFYNAMLPDLADVSRVGRWSGWAWSIGYAGGLACLIVALAVFVKPEPAPFGLDRASAEHVRATFLLVAAWYLVFSLPLFLVTPDSPSTGTTFSVAMREGLAQLVDSLHHVRRYRHIVRFLIAHMIYADGLGTVFAFGGVFAASAFGMREEEVLVFGIALNVTAGVGAAAFGWVDDRIGSRSTILISLAGLFVAITGMLAVETKTWFWVWGMGLGVFVGPVQAASRSFMARAAPPRLRTQMFGLYALSGKATAFLGPLLVGWITAWTNNQRAGMATVLLFFGAGFLLIRGVRLPSSNAEVEPGTETRQDHRP